MGTQVFIQVLPDMLNRKTPFLPDAPLNDVGPDWDSKSADRLRGSA